LNDQREITRGIVRKPGTNFSDGLTTSILGRPNYRLALAQHADYCKALESCGLELTVLEEYPQFPDGTFVEDVAVLTPESAILTYLGAIERRGEVDLIRPVLERYFERFYTIAPPGMLDGGDVCEAGDHYFIGISERTNPEGARQLADFLRLEGYCASLVDIRGTPGILHLKSGLAFLGQNRLVVIDVFADRAIFQDYELIRVSPEENYAANCLRLNDKVLIADGFDDFKATLEQSGYALEILNMSEFQKMDGGISCLSLRFS
jgi:dimethylargininase